MRIDVIYDLILNEMKSCVALWDIGIVCDFVMFHYFFAADSYDSVFI